VKKGLNYVYADSETIHAEGRKKPCVFVANPFPECYCTKMDSRNVAAAVYYCGDRFIECEIYKANTTGNQFC